MDYKEKYEKALKAAQAGCSIEDIFPELKENKEQQEDEKIRRFISNELACLRATDEKGSDRYEELTDAIAWLEKQGEQKQHLELKAGHWYFCHQAYCERTDILTVKEGERFMCEKDGIVKGLIVKNPEKYFREISTPSDNVEPKFKVGDWVVSPNGVYWHIDAIRDGRYQVSSDLGYCADWPLNTNIYHKFTIQDAKDGDVLSYTDTFKRTWVFLYKYLRHNEPLRDFPISYHGLVKSGDFYPKGSMIIDIEYITPSNTEQRGLLFSKMKEAGYEWDVKKKELKKIEQEQTELPNGEDFGIDSLYHAAKILEKTLGEVEGYQSDDGILEHKCAIEVVNRLYKQKPAWSEEDESCKNTILCAVQGKFVTQAALEQAIGWLKSLKERMKGE